MGKMTKKRKFYLKFKKIMRSLYEWIRSLFVTRYNIHVSYNSEWGDSDDQYFEDVRKITKQTHNELKFIDNDKSPVIIRSAAGLNYRIEEV
jgi:hypothetical protein